jgi:hypothetical protein
VQLGEETGSSSSMQMRPDVKFSARRCKRIPRCTSVPLLVEVEGQEIKHSANMVDFSELGIRIEASATLTPGQTVQVILGTEPDHVYTVPGRVVWAGEPGSKLEGQAGLEFLRPFGIPTDTRVR